MNPNARLRTGVVAVMALGVVLSVAAPADAVPPKRTPAPVVTVTPASPTNGRTATFTFTDSAPAAVFTCSFDGARYAACTSPVTKTGLAAGTHTLSVRATVPTWRSATASKQIVVDLTAPVAPVISGMPVGATNAAIHPTFTDASTDVKGYLCSVDGAVAGACTSGA
ncbi:MAG TPA: hypothetical protein VFL59_05365, partial [Candidatus Nanopelagicales bacterium]|nr:hypothetical protein [Candidatus Nanopelagicales bacterium]